MKRPLGACLFTVLAIATTSSANAGIVGPNESVTRAASGVSTKDSTGIPVDGLAVALGTTTPTVSYGSPVRINIEVRNVSSTMQFLAIPLSPCAYLISLTNTATRAKSDISPKGCPVYSAGAWNLEVGKSEFLAFRISDYAKIPVGTYTVRIEGLWRYPNEQSAFRRIKIESNAVSITVTP
jgi:hypothetical protein